MPCHLSTGEPKCIGIDVGLDGFAALSNGEEIDNPRHLKCGLAHLIRAQRRLSRRKRTSRRHHKAAALVAKAHRKIRNQRAAFHHELSCWLVKHYSLIAVKDLNIKGLSRGILAGPVHDAGWNSFFAKLSYKAANAGRELVKVDPRGTSQICICGAAVPRLLRSVGIDVRYAGCRRPVTWSVRKSYCNAPGSGVRGIT